MTLKVQILSWFLLQIQSIKQFLKVNKEMSSDKNETS